jgi:hypothetical protein
MTFRAILLTSALGLFMAVPASATTIYWTQWSDVATIGTTSGAATGTIATTPGVSVSYSGEVEQMVFGYPSWGPASTFDAGGLNAPPSAGGIVRIFGGLTSTDTITFSTPVTDPYFAIWSLGQPGIDASFVFSATPVLDSGGPSNEYGGSSIAVSGNTVSGFEANGVVHFTGTFSSISWNNPVAENWYGFTVGIAGVASPPPGVPEPLTLSLFGAGLAGIAAMRRRKKSA